ncbi:MAG TPA: heavy metal-binding domain-containing protein [Thermoanaerobaculia bacterium]|jgi:hypothetical protein|nr:heavy metal-binding domain-containing protein [Thermoanaerobaculia bacterium]
MKKHFLIACTVLAAACASVPPNSPADTHTHHATVQSDVDPAATLQPDAFDSAVPVSVAESTRIPGATPDPHAHHRPPTTDNGQLTYVCPMHPDVTSATPGKCPRCGMSLVIKKDKP